MLSWTKINNYALRSECGEWFISKIIVCGQVRFELKKRVPPVGRDATVHQKAKVLTGEDYGWYLTTAEAKQVASGKELTLRRVA